MGFGGLGLLGGAPETIRLANSVTIRGPAGYCIDSSATRDAASGGFVLLGSCASITNNARAASPRVPGVLTASVSAQSGGDIDASMDRLAGFFNSVAGRAALARDGNAGSVTLLSTSQRGGVFFIRARDTSANIADGLADEYWRALFDIRGRIVTLSVIGFDATAPSEAQGLANLTDFIARVRAANPVRAGAGDAANPA